MSTEEKNKQSLECDFCSKKQYEVKKLIAGPGVYICNECVELCTDIIREEDKSQLVRSGGTLPSPNEIHEVLDDYVIGQRMAICFT
mgnify:CR=1 FL=1